jgi:hypothetical protein
VFDFGIDVNFYAPRLPFSPKSIVKRLQLVAIVAHKLLIDFN